MSRPWRIVIAGGGLAAVRSAEALRALGHDGPLVLLSQEQELPYDRPPLSKDVLLGTGSEQALRLLDDEDAARLELDVRLGHRVVGLDTSASTVQVEGRDDVAYDALIVATGSRPRRLPAVPAAADVHSVSTHAEADALAAALVEGARVVVVGAGFIGLEVASCAVARGARVTVVEAAPQPLQHALGPDIAAWLQDHHAAGGVTFRCGVTVVGGDPDDAQARLQLSDGDVLAADVVVVGVGVERDVEWLRDAGVQVEKGLVCDDAGRTTTPGVFGAGDVVERVGPNGSALIAHWTAAADSAERVARAVLGLDLPAPEDDAYFWSHQGRLRLQAVGHHLPGATTVVVSGGFEEGAFVAHYERDGELVGVVAANSPRAFLQSRRSLHAQLAPTA